MSDTSTSLPQKQTHRLAIVSLVLGVVSLPGLFFPPFLGLGVAGIVTGWVARKQIARSGGELKGNGLAIAGIAVSVVGTLLSSVLPAFVVYVWIYAAFHGGQLPFGT